MAFIRDGKNWPVRSDLKKAFCRTPISHHLVELLDIIVPARGCGLHELVFAGVLVGHLSIDAAVVHTYADRPVVVIPTEVAQGHSDQS